MGAGCSSGGSGVRLDSNSCNSCKVSPIDDNTDHDDIDSVSNQNTILSSNTQSSDISNNSSNLGKLGHDISNSNRRSRHSRHSRIPSKVEDHIPLFRNEHSSASMVNYSIPMILRNAYDNMPFIVILTSSSGEILYCNGRVKTSLDYSPRDIIGKNLSTTLVCKNSRGKIIDFFNRNGDNNINHDNECDIRIRLLNKSGEERWAEIYMKYTMNGGGDEIMVIINNIQIEMQLVELLASAHRDIVGMRNIINNVFPKFILKRIMKGHKEFIINYDRLIVGALDIVNYTENCLLDNASFQVMRSFYFQTGQFVDRHNLLVVDIIGDAVIVVANYDPKLAVQSVEDVIDFMVDMINFVKETMFLKIRCGIAEGRGSMGMIECNQWRTHALGPVTNAASRMEQSASPNTIRITSRIHDNIKNTDKYRMEQQELIHVKSLGMMKTYEITGYSDAGVKYCNIRDGIISVDNSGAGDDDKNVRGCIRLTNVKSKDDKNRDESRNSSGTSETPTSSSSSITNRMLLRSLSSPMFQ